MGGEGRERESKDRVGRSGMHQRVLGADPLEVPLFDGLEQAPLVRVLDEFVEDGRGPKALHTASVGRLDSAVEVLEGSLARGNVVKQLDLKEVNLGS